MTIDALTDSVFGNLFLRGDCGTLENAELAPDDGAAGGADEATCAFTALVSGNAGDSHHNVATVTGHDEDERPSPTTTARTSRSPTSHRRST